MIVWKEYRSILTGLVITMDNPNATVWFNVAQAPFSLAKMPKAPILLTIALLSIASALADSDKLRFENAWTPEAPPGRMMAGFMEIHNPGSEPVAIVGARAEGFGHVELHNTTMEDGVMRMRRIDTLTVDPGGSLTLEPGGLHLMLIEPERSFRDGDQIALVLIDSESREYPVASKVRPRRR